MVCQSNYGQSSLIELLILYIEWNPPGECGNKKEPIMQEIRYLDKLIDELAKGKSMDKILREK